MGGAIVDAGTGGSNVDAPYDGPTGITPFAAGQLVITEIMADSNDVPDESGEWFELYNPSTTDTYDLFGCVLGDKQQSGHGRGSRSRCATVLRDDGAVRRPLRVVSLPTYDYHTTVMHGDHGAGHERRRQVQQ